MTSFITAYASNPYNAQKPYKIPRPKLGLKFGTTIESNDTASFSAPDSKETAQKIQLATATIPLLEQAEKKPVLDNRDQTALTQLKKLLGFPESTPGPKAFSAEFYNTLSTGNPKKRQDLLSNLVATLKASLAATQSSPLFQKVGDQTLQIHNTQLQPFIKPSYTAPQLEQLFQVLHHMGVFDLKIHPENGLPYTTTATFNKAMNFQWNTDSMEIGKNLQRFVSPESYKQNLLDNAAVMNTQQVQNTVVHVIEDPNWYRKESDPMHGIPHIFDPASIHINPTTSAPIVSEIGFDPNWHNQKRLESSALVLHALVDNVKDGLIPDSKGAVKPWGFNQTFIQNPAQLKQVTNAITNISIYLSRINTNPSTQRYDMKAPSASSWEEQALAGGCTSDTGDTVLAFESLKDLLYNPQYNHNKGIQTVRQALKNNSYSVLIPTEKQMNQIIATGRKVIDERITTPLNQGKIPRQSEAREADTSLMFLAASDYKFDPKNVTRDTQIRLALVNAMEKELMQSNGMMRYGESRLPGGEKVFDSYLQLDNHVSEEIRQPLHTLLSSKLGLQPYRTDNLSPHHDVTDKLGQLTRQSGGSEQFSAQWGLGVSAGLQCLAAAKVNLLNTMLKNNKAPSKEELALLKQVDTQLNRYLNKNLALITGKDTKGNAPVSSTGLPLPENTVMEAYEYVLNLNQQPVMLPGAHPLTWGETQLFDGLVKSYDAAKLEEKLNQKFNLKTID
jgi:hypothetical protein